MCIASCLPSASQHVGARSLALERDEHADLAEAGRDCALCMYGDDHALARPSTRSHAADLLVLADRRDVVGQLLAHGAATRIARPP